MYYIIWLQPSNYSPASKMALSFSSSSYERYAGIIVALHLFSLSSTI